MLSLATLILASGPALAEPPPAALPCGALPPGMVCVPAGPFLRGSNEDRHSCQQRFGEARRERPNTGPAAELWLQTFYLDGHEVTFAAYAECIEAGDCSRRPEDERWGPRYTDFGRPRQPITGVSWYQAEEYCRARGKSLPTEAQWEKAARGPDGAQSAQGSPSATCDDAVIRDAKLGRSCGVKKRGSSKTGRVLEVGSRPAAGYGLFDMIGNAEEWVADWYSDDYADCGEACLGIEPKGPCDGAERCAGHRFKVVRGGSWYWDATHATAVHRRPHFPDNAPPKRFHHFGFRCAASAAQAEALTRASP